MNTSIKKQRPAIIQKWLFQKLLLKILNNWLWILISVITGFTVAFLINRYTNKIHRTSIEVVKGNPEPGREEASFLFSNPYQTSQLNTKYERSFITSLPNMKRVIDELDLQVSYFSRGRVKTTKRFGHLPIRLECDSSSTELPYNIMITVQNLSANTFRLETENETWAKRFEGHTFRFGEDAAIGDFRFKVYKQGEMKNGDWLFLIHPLESLAKNLQGSVRVNEVHSGYSTGRGNISMLELSMQSSLPQKDLLILNKLIEIMEEEDVKRKNERSKRTIDFIEEQLVQISDSMKMVATQMRTLMLSEKELTEGSPAVFQRINDLEKQKNELLLINRYIDYLKEYFKRQVKGEIMVPSSFGIDNNILGGLVTEYISTILELRNLEEMAYTGQVYNREKKLLEAKLRDLEEMMLESIKSSREVNEFKIRELETQIGMLFLSARSVMSNEVVYADYERLYNLNENVFTMLMDKKSEAEIMEASIISDYRVLEPARTVYPPLKPNTRKNYFAGIFLGFFIPIGFFFIQILNRNTLLSLSELEELVDLPLAGVIGFSNNPKTLMERPQSLISENFRSLRSNLRFVNRGEDHTMFAVTSSVSEEGKTFISANLAIVMALQEKKTILVGADMRKPSLDNYFESTARRGLSDFLANRAELQEVIAKTDHENLDIIFSGPVPPNPAELLSGKNMKDLISILKKKYDYIIFDSPPIGLISDAAELFSDCHSILLVTRQQKTPVNNLQHIDHFMDLNFLKKTWLIFNGVRKGFGYGYYGYGYGYGGDSGYFSDEGGR